MKSPAVSRALRLIISYSSVCGLDSAVGLGKVPQLFAPTRVSRLTRKHLGRAARAALICVHDHNNAAMHTAIRRVETGITTKKIKRSKLSMTLAKGRADERKLACVKGSSHDCVGTKSVIPTVSPSF
jgi:hypothetical protein